MTVIDIDKYQVRVDTGSKIVTLNTSRILSTITEHDNWNLRLTLKTLYELKTKDTLEVLRTERLPDDDPISRTEAFKITKYNEILGLLNFNALTIFSISQTPRDASLWGSFSLALKNVSKSEDHCKARFFGQWNTVSERNMNVLDSSNISHQIISMIFWTAALYQFNLWTYEVSQAYLQNCSKFTGDVCVQPRQIFWFKAWKILKLHKALYLFTIGGDYWHVTLNKYLKVELLITSLDEDLAYFTDTVQRKLSCILEHTWTTR